MKKRSQTPANKIELQQIIEKYTKQEIFTPKYEHKVVSKRPSKNLLKTTMSEANRKNKIKTKTMTSGKINQYGFISSISESFEQGFRHGRHEKDPAWDPIPTKEVIDAELTIEPRMIPKASRAEGEEENLGAAETHEIETNGDKLISVKLPEIFSVIPGDEIAIKKAEQLLKSARTSTQDQKSPFKTPIFGLDSENALEFGVNNDLIGVSFPKSGSKSRTASNCDSSNWEDEGQYEPPNIIIDGEFIQFDETSNFNTGITRPRSGSSIITPLALSVESIRVAIPDRSKSEEIGATDIAKSTSSIMNHSFEKLDPTTITRSFRHLNTGNERSESKIRNLELLESKAKGDNNVLNIKSAPKYYSSPFKPDLQLFSIKNEMLPPLSSWLSSITQGPPLSHCPVDWKHITINAAAEFGKTVYKKDILKLPQLERDQKYNTSSLLPSNEITKPINELDVEKVLMVNCPALPIKSKRKFWETPT
jgi:hypothetical protein